jgi:hypothetical protein
VALAVCFTLAAGGAARADDQADMKKLVDKAVKAAGGAEKLAKVKAFTMKFKGKVHVDGNAYNYTAEWFTQFPDRQKIVVNVDINGQNFTITRVLNQTKGWVKMGDNEATAMTKKRVATEKEDLYARSLANLVGLRAKGIKLAPVGEVDIGNKKAVGVKVSRKGHKDVNMYFDKKTCLLLKMEITTKDMDTDKEVTITTFYKDYKKTDGLMHPTKMTIKKDGKDYVDVTEISEYTVEDKLDASTFDKP